MNQKKIITFALSFFALALLSNTSLAANEHTSTINEIGIYTDYGNGDVVVILDTVTSPCYGYWLDGTSPGFDQSYSALLSAKHANTQVALTFHPSTTEKWSGSGNFYCRLVRVRAI